MGTADTSFETLLGSGTMDSKRTTVLVRNVITNFTIENSPDSSLSISKNRTVILLHYQLGCRVGLPEVHNRWQLSVKQLAKTYVDSNESPCLQTLHRDFSR